MHNFRTLYLRITLSALILAANGVCYCNSYALPGKGGAITRRKAPFHRRLRNPTFQDRIPNHYEVGGISINSTTMPEISIATAIQFDPVNMVSKASQPLIAKTSGAKNKISIMDFAVFFTYYCNMVVVTLSVVTVPAMAMEHRLTPQATAAFCASVASMASLGGGVGKLVNGFVCESLGGHQASWTYLVALSVLKMAMSFSNSLAPIGLFLIGIDFLSSIQWTSICAVMRDNYGHNPRKVTRGITLLSLSSTIGALSAKTIGAGLLEATGWRTVCRCGSLIALFGACVMYFIGDVDPALKNKRNGKVARQRSDSPLVAMKTIFSNPIFWMFGIGHSLGSLARSSDRLVGPFLQEVGGISGTLAAGLTSSVTIGFVLGLLQGSGFSKMKSISEKMKMVKKNCVVAVLSTLGLAACGLKGLSQLLGGNTNAIILAITIFSGLLSSAVSFQFYQFANLMSSNIFPEHTSVALSFTDGVGFFVTAGVLGLNSRLLGNFGWCTSWIFIATAFGVGGMFLTRAIQPVLVKASEN
mmetsp:Transcript_28532/g.77232  ORF Transcript_28532/g.77232 Transcript_28532/m.77232 type:complete len:528 (+) Transcript_28532:280-1863(+)